MRNCFQDRVNYQCQGSSLSDLSTFDNPLAERIDSLPCKDDVAEREINFSLATSFSFSKSSEKKKAIYQSATHLFISTHLSCLHQDGSLLTELKLVHRPAVGPSPVISKPWQNTPAPLDALRQSTAIFRNTEIFQISSSFPSKP